VPVPALKGPKGVRYAAWDYYTPYLLNTILITKNCAHPDVLVRWADYQMELEATMGAYAGTKVKNWDWAKKGMNSIMDEQAVYTTKVWPAPVRTSWNQYSAMYRTNDFRLGQAADPKNPTFESALYHASQKPYFPYKEPKKMQLPPLIFSQADAAQIADISTSMTNQVNQAMAQFATAKLDIDDDGAWTKYTSAIDKIGLQQYLQTYQQAYDKQVKG
jgi:putative aldouronate transport system substrate-binding protein